MTSDLSRVQGGGRLKSVKIADGSWAKTQSSRVCSSHVTVLPTNLHPAVEAAVKSAVVEEWGGVSVFDHVWNINSLSTQKLNSGYYTGGGENLHAVPLPGDTGERTFYVRHGECSKGLFSVDVGVQTHDPKTHSPAEDANVRGFLKC